MDQQYIVNFNNDSGDQYNIDKTIIERNRVLTKLFFDNQKRIFQPSITLDKIDPKMFAIVIAVIKNKNSEDSISQAINSIEPSQLIEFIYTCNYFEMRELLDRGSEKFKELINNNNFSEIRKIMKMNIE